MKRDHGTDTRAKEGAGRAGRRARWTMAKDKNKRMEAWIEEFLCKEYTDIFINFQEKSTSMHVCVF